MVQKITKNQDVYCENQDGSVLGGGSSYDWVRVHQGLVGGCRILFLDLSRSYKCSFS